MKTCAISSAGETRKCARPPQRISDRDNPERLIKDHEDHDRQPPERTQQSEDRQCRIRRPNAVGHRLRVVPRTLVIYDRSPGLQTYPDEHQEIEHSEKVNIYRANTLISFIVWREDIFDD